MVSVDVPCDLMDEDETGYVWTFLREARHPELIQPGAIVIAGNEDAPAVAEVIDIVVKPAGHVVHLRLLPGATEERRTKRFFGGRSNRLTRRRPTPDVGQESGLG